MCTCEAEYSGIDCGIKLAGKKLHMKNDSSLMKYVQGEWQKKIFDVATIVIDYRFNLAWPRSSDIAHVVGCAFFKAQVRAAEFL